MSGALFAGPARKAVADLTAASSVFMQALEGAVDSLRLAELDDHVRTVERIREHARLFHAQLDTLAGRLTSEAVL